MFKQNDLERSRNIPGVVSHNHRINLHGNGGVSEIRRPIRIVNVFTHGTHMVF